MCCLSRTPSFISKLFKLPLTSDPGMLGPWQRRASTWAAEGTCRAPASLRVQREEGQLQGCHQQVAALWSPLALVQNMEGV